MTQKFTNAARSTLARAVVSQDTGVLLADGTGELFPMADDFAGTWWYLTLQEGDRFEIVKVTYRDGDYLGVERGQQNTNVQDWIAGTACGLRLTADDATRWTRAAEAAGAGGEPDSSLVVYDEDTGRVSYVEEMVDGDARTTVPVYAGDGLGLTIDEMYLTDGTNRCVLDPGVFMKHTHSVMNFQGVGSKNLFVRSDTTTLPTGVTGNATLYSFDTPDPTALPPGYDGKGGFELYDALTPYWMGDGAYMATFSMYVARVTFPGTFFVTIKTRGGKVLASREVSPQPTGWLRVVMTVEVPSVAEAGTDDKRWLVVTVEMRDMGPHDLAYGESYKAKYGYWQASPEDNSFRMTFERIETGVLATPWGWEATNSLIRTSDYDIYGPAGDSVMVFGALEDATRLGQALKWSGSYTRDGVQYTVKDKAITLQDRDPDHPTYVDNHGFHHDVYILVPRQAGVAPSLTPVGSLDKIRTSYRGVIRTEQCKYDAAGRFIGFVATQEGA